jgi:hypothetical protein
MKFIFLSSLLFFWAFTSTAQYDAPSWYYIVDAFNDADISDVEMDSSGNTYVVVNYQGALNLEGNNGRPLSVGEHNAGALLKLDRQGKLVWCRGIDSAFDNRIRDLCIGADGSLYFTGFADGEVKFPGKSKDLFFGRKKEQNEYHQPQAIYVAKYSKDGEPIWINFWTTAWGEGTNVAVNSKGEVAWSYYHNAELMSGDKMIDGFEYKRGYESKVSIAFLAADGQLKHIKHLGGFSTNYNNMAPKLKYDQKDHLYCIGKFKQSVLLTENDSLVNDGYYDSLDAFIAKYSPNGELEWVRQFGGENVQQIHDVEIAPDGSVYGAGEYYYECVLMDGIKANQKSRYEYKSGSNTFYFHLFDHGETDFIQFYEGDKYSGYFVGASIDLDVNGETHLFGTYNDTLELEGFTIETPYDLSTPFLSTMQNEKMIELKGMARLDKSWISGQRIRSVGDAYAMGMLYYGEDIRIQIGDREVKIKNQDYGRGTLIIGGKVQRKKTDEQVIAEQREGSRLERLESLEALLICSNPELSEASTTWFPISQPLDEFNDPFHLVDDHAGSDVGVNLTPCGMTLDEVEAILFPNPTVGPLSLQLKGMQDGNAQIDVLSEMGQLMFSKRIQIPSADYTMELDMSSAAAGNYFIRITYANFEKALRLVKVSK